MNRALACLLLVLALPSARAALDHPVLNSLDDVLQMTNEQNPTLLKADATIAEMHASHNVAIAGYVPSLSLQSTISSNEILLAQKIWDGGAAIGQINLADQRQKMSEMDKKVAQRAIQRQAIEFYYDAIFALMKQRYLVADAKRSSEALEKTKKQFKFRAIGHDALLRAQVDYRRERTEMYEAANAIRFSARALSHLTRRPDFAPDWLTEKIDVDDLPLPLQPKVAEQEDELFAARPENQFLHFNDKAIDAQRQIDDATDLPNISYLASYGFGRTAPAMSVGYVYQSGMQYGFSLTIPLTSGYSLLSKSQMYEQKHLETAHDREALKNDFDFEYREHFATLSDNWADLQTIHEELKSSEELLKDVDANFRIGLIAPDIWFAAAENVRQWKLRQLQSAKVYAVEYQYIKRLLLEE